MIQGESLMVKLQADSLDWALNHIELSGDTDIFPIPFEYDAIRLFWDSEVKPYLLNEDVTKWQCHPLRRTLSPKHRFGFRISTQLDPLDTLVYLALVYEIGADIEAARVPAAANVVFSYRFAPHPSGAFFDPRFSYNNFQKHSQQLLASPDCSHVVVADIADFYPRLYAHPLENALKACTKQAGHVTSIHGMLAKWNYSVSYGIPVGPSPSRLLAELAINDVDQALLSEGKRFCRYGSSEKICNTTSEEYATQ
jgi:hypothetical protein